MTKLTLKNNFNFSWMILIGLRDTPVCTMAYKIQNRLEDRTVTTRNTEKKPPKGLVLDHSIMKYYLGKVSFGSYVYNV